MDLFHLTQPYATPLKFQPYTSYLVNYFIDKRIFPSDFGQIRQRGQLKSTQLKRRPSLETILRRPSVSQLSVEKVLLSQEKEAEVEGRRQRSQTTVTPFTTSQKKGGEEAPKFEYS